MLILNYHRVGTPSRNHRYRGMFVSPALLDFHIRFLKRAGYGFVTLAEAITTPAPRDRLACITFDDGYQDNLGGQITATNHSQN